MTTAALDLMASFVLEDGSRWGDTAAPWQWERARDHFDAASPPFTWDQRPRGGRKTTDAAAAMAVDLLTVLPPGSTCHDFASDRDQARLMRDCVFGFTARTPGLSSALVVDAYRVTATATGSWVEIMSADAASAYGLRSARTVADELCQWPDTPSARTLWQAVVSGMGKVPGAKLSVTTTPGSPGSWQHGVYLAAKASPLWRVAEVRGPLPWVSDAFLDDQRGQLPPSVHARMHLGEWHAGEDKLTDPSDLERCIVQPGPQGPEAGRRYVVTADLGIVHDASVVSVSHGEQTSDAAGRVVGRRVVLDQLRVWRGTRRHPVQLADVEAAISEFAHQFDARVVCDPHEAVSILQNLRSKGVAAEPFLFTAQSVGRLALALYQAIKSGTLAIWRDEDLVSELLNVRLVEKGPGQFRLDHASSGHDDMAVCLAMATATLLERPVTGGWGHLFGAKVCPSCGAVVPESDALCKCGAELVVVTPTPLSENVWAKVYGVNKPKPVQPGANGGGWYGGAPRGPWFGGRT